MSSSMPHNPLNNAPLPLQEPLLDAVSLHSIRYYLLKKMFLSSLPDRIKRMGCHLIRTHWARARGRVGQGPVRQTAVALSLVRKLKLI